MTTDGIGNKYNGYGKICGTSKDKNDEECNINLYMMSKYEPSHVEQHRLIGNMKYTTSVMYAIFNKLVIVNCHLQSSYLPSDKSIKTKWFHYARCRLEQLRSIQNSLIQFMPRFVMMCCNFNINMDGSLDEWPELKGLREFGGIDCWRHFYADDFGYTEINPTRWKNNPPYKQFRYDGIFLKKSNAINDRMTIVDIKLVGSEGYIWKNINKQSNSDMIYFPSDRFGVMGSFSTIDDLL